jgi:hypothetical protein
MSAMKKIDGAAGEITLAKQSKASRLVEEESKLRNLEVVGPIWSRGALVAARG